MDCDALKKALLKDLDGTFLGHIGAVIPQSEFEWDTNPVRGLGDYRIPKEMLTKMDGTRIPVKEIAPKKGWQKCLQSLFCSSPTKNLKAAQRHAKKHHDLQIKIQF
ncbi:hypothetical protein DPMN_079572 [Dreissena polymorpha]|uniref:Uncharacterized protein n=1 Tax=Dreissena polymorpha TaxID=45954 RepID=A0A9D3YU06_DREPO|nr:hypothetical protein DPMN_079572 [Dreissena polymorpha]